MAKPKSDAQICFIPPIIRRTHAKDGRVFYLPIKVRRHGDKFPTNGNRDFKSYDETIRKAWAGHCIDSLHLKFWADDNGRIWGFAFVYREPYMVGLEEVKAMAKTLGALANYLKKQSSDSDTLEAHMEALEAVFGHVAFANPAGDYSSYSDTIWTWDSWNEGGVFVQRLIDTNATTV